MRTVMRFVDYLTNSADDENKATSCLAKFLKERLDAEKVLYVSVENGNLKEVFSNPDHKGEADAFYDLWCIANGGPVSEFNKETSNFISMVTHKNEVMGALRVINARNTQETTPELLGSILGVFALTVFNIRKQNELSRRNTLYNELLETSTTGIALEKNRRIVYANSELARILGYSDPSELVDKSPLDILDPIHTKESEQAVHLVKNSLARMDSMRRKAKRADGKFIDIEVTLSPCIIDGDVAIRVSVEDITQEVNLEREQARNTKLESLGTLAAGIAHDFRNNLSIISGNLSLLKNSLSGGNHETVERFSRIEAAVKDADLLTKRFVCFAKGGAPIRRVISVRDWLEKTSSLTLAGSKVLPTYDIQDDIKDIEGDIGQLTGVINNILINAIQALPKGGNCHIAARNQIVNSLELGLESGEYVTISITDDGDGISVGIINNIFDPYFTTKKNGVGLGLTASLTTVKRHGGTITVKSTKGQGTTFTMYLPTASVQTATAISAVQPGCVHKGSGRILLMDDNDQVRRSCEDMLRHLGYDVETARNGEQAVQMFRESLESHPYDVVLLDLVIPGEQSGDVIMQKILSIDPGTKGILFSAYSDDSVMANHSEYGFKASIQKPCSLEEISVVIRGVLDN